MFCTPPPSISHLAQFPSYLKWLFLWNFMTPFDALKRYYDRLWPTFPDGRPYLHLHLMLVISCTSCPEGHTKFPELHAVSGWLRVYHVIDLHDPAPMTRQPFSCWDELSHLKTVFKGRRRRCASNAATVLVETWAFLTLNPDSNKNATHSKGCNLPLALD